MATIILFIVLMIISIFLLRAEEWDQISRDAEEEKY